MSWRNHERLPKDLLWTCPEILRDTKKPFTSKGDVYSFSIILHEIIYREGAFFCEDDAFPAEGLMILFSFLTKIFCDLKRHNSESY